MSLKLDDLTVPPHPSAIDLNLSLAIGVAAIKEARSIHKQLMGELQEFRRSTVPPARLPLSRRAVQALSDSDDEGIEAPDTTPMKVRRRINTRTR